LLHQTNADWRGFGSLALFSADLDPNIRVGFEVENEAVQPSSASGSEGRAFPQHLGSKPNLLWRAENRLQTGWMSGQRRPALTARNDAL